jgi:hypothetical protein
MTMRMARATLAAVLAGSTVLAAGPDDARKAFSEAWRGRRVEVKRTLYTLVFNERGKLGKVSNDKREGLLVATPSSGTYFQFDGRDSEQDIVARDPQQVADRIGDVYRRQEPLEIGFYLRIEPELVVRYEAGGMLTVKDVQVERNRVRLSFTSVAADAPRDQVATSLTIQWPTDLSAGFTERPLIDALIRQFVDDVRPARTASGIRN